MTTTVQSGLFGLGGVVLGAILKAVLPEGSISGMIRRGPSHVLLGRWDSGWGPLPVGPVRHHEVIEFKRHRGSRVFGTATLKQGDKVWEIEGRYDGQF